MSSVKELSLKLDKIKKREENKKCFDCGEKGTTYACTTFGTFICSRCAGILRELNYKVKGTGVSIFSQTEIDLLDKMGNINAAKTWLAKYKDGKEKSPGTMNDEELRNFFKDKYKEKKWYKKPKKSKDEDEDEKEEKKGKKKGGKKKKPDSDEEDEDDDDKDDSDNEESDSDEEEKEKEKEKENNQNKKK